MPISDAQLGFDCHLDYFRRLGVLTGDVKEDAHFYRQAEYMHALCICDAIRDIHFDAATLSYSVKNPEANFHIRFGIARRTKFIWLSIRGVLGLVMPDRTEPLPRDDVEQIARDLNVIYINIPGTLDNIAWLLLDLFGNDETRSLPPVKISLFGNEYLKDQNLAAFAQLIEPYKAWNRELRGRRDPAAHRIPLSVIPAIIDAETKDEYELTLEQYNEAINEAFKDADNWEIAEPKFEKAHALHDKLESIGKFVPLFAHHPDEGSMKIYPTVPQDIGQLVRIAQGVFDIIKARLSDARLGQQA